ncbi:hypothetical protein ACVWW1_004394 [Bradyrhizobium sp. JR3.5]
MSLLTSIPRKSFASKLPVSGLLAGNLDYHIVRASMVILFFFFGYQKWWAYEADRLEPFISNGPLIWWLYPAFGHQGASWFLGVSEWTFGALIFAGFWSKRLGILGALGSTWYLHCDGHDHSVHAGWLGRCGGRLSGDDGQCPIPDEGCRAACGVVVSSEARHGAGREATCGLRYPARQKQSWRAPCQ